MQKYPLEALTTIPEPTMAELATTFLDNKEAYNAIKFSVQYCKGKD